MIIAIIDYGMGNLLSLSNAISKVDKNVDIILSSDKNVIYNSDLIFLPGVGHFKKAMESLYSLDLVRVIREDVLINKKPVFGICLGMQLLFSESEEGGGSEGLNLLKGSVKKLSGGNCKIPHIGFNSISNDSRSLMMKNIENKDFYFVHSYCVQNSDEDYVKIFCRHNKPFLAAFEKDNIWGTQFHPEKSQNNGLILIKNFIEAWKQKKD
jgi:imidazole glycerol-phosphate synthase subunit HisH